MAEIAEVYIVGRGREYLKSDRPDILAIPHAHTFSPSVYDAKQIRRVKDAKKLAKKIGGDVWKFIPATGSREKMDFSPPKGAKCDTCGKWTPFDGICRNPESEYYRTPVSMNEVCDEWEA